ncbi:MAG TPA: hypothetical protein VHD32_17890 [Candidatus Didemnitutus sp.]|nr:hypothetical protein [Candidatus Didemnitutus sp.]
MKTAIISILTATFLGVLAFASGRSFSAADFFTILFSVGLVAWTVDQYTREPRSLNFERPIRLPVAPKASKFQPESQRLAA